MKNVQQQNMVISMAMIFIIALISLVLVGCGRQKSPVVEATPSSNTVKISAKQFEFSPREISIKKGVPVSLVFTSQDVTHGVSCPGLNIRADINPGSPTIVKITPDKAGRFEYTCDVMCGPGHTDMKGMIIVTE
ncbi:MAG: cupredoxin domain-containing protein [bacterium]